MTPEERAKRYRILVRVSGELRAKLRWLAYIEERPQQVIVEEILEEALQDVEVPELPDATELGDDEDD